MEQTGTCTEQSRSVLRVEGLRKAYRSGAAELVVFDNLSFRVAPGELVAVVGQSGSGKSTLLHIVGVLDSPSAGELYFAHVRLRALKEEDAANFRNRQVGYVWQFHYLLPEFTAEENVAMPLLIRGDEPDEALSKAHQLLAQVGLAERAHHRSGELSGGEQQRVSLARALVTAPKLLLADEPTGDLDGRTAEAVFELIRNLHRVHGLTSLIATHNVAFARRCDRVLRLQQGQLEEVNPASLPAM